ncbi:DNA polymerase III subunit gamma/tau [Gloeocapsopsis dulcis]|uniref:DNA polymerase III subunit gamma/tau n=1 Tax=Gloeocapsopsis dulcis AAB1 = 1H9 TaxID=1433147 RepID=A0A6N8G234_9CHRO|nr:DNA polymerase III subunit gamma/tau [Gloeocapsopsis dulcis]MUL39159.1 DNA polymerase III subunit gamma/tau [Gloeocapsopsis dulcis AAB1 = 1H9]WNN91829.1 DNA polymerase III subunit gamma/tau [Gloeocapsopsis dulcis]
MYEPLHHKYRPQNFAQLVGQEAITTTLSNAVRTSRIAPAYLFTGPRGTGKTSSARILAKSLNCLASNVPTAEPCGVCEVCRGIANGSALDVIEIDAASNTGVDNIREIIERSQFAPVQCRYKVYAIDECHMLSTAAFNALLKTLEEPPPHVVFVLATTDPQRVLPTIISRCQRFDFRRIPLEPMVQHLQAIAAQEQIQITNEAITLVAQLSQGGLRDAESLLDQLMLSGSVTVESVWDLVGAVAEPDLLALLEAITHNNAEQLLDRTRQLLERGREPLIILQNLASYYRDLLIAKTAPHRNDLVACTPTTWQAMCHLVQQWEIATILEGQKNLKASEVQIKTSTQPRLWLEVTLLGLLPVTRTPELSLVSINRHSNTNPSAVKDTPHPQTPPAVITAPEIQPIQQEVVEPSPPPPVVHQDNLETSNEEDNVEIHTEVVANQSVDLEQVWQQLLQNLPLPSKALFKEHGSLVALYEQQASIGIRSPKLLKIAQTKVSDLEAALGKLYDRKIKVQLEVAATHQAKVSAVSVQAVPQPPRIPVSTDSPQTTALAPSTTSTLVKTQSASLEAVPETPITEPLLSPDNSDATDEVAIAAQRLADFFKGEILQLNDGTMFTQPMTTSSLPPQAALDWDDTEDTDFDF